MVMSSVSVKVPIYKVWTGFDVFFLKKHVRGVCYCVHCNTHYLGPNNTIITRKIPALSGLYPLRDFIQHHLASEVSKIVLKNSFLRLFSNFCSGFLIKDLILTIYIYISVTVFFFFFFF